MLCRNKRTVFIRRRSDGYRRGNSSAPTTLTATGALSALPASRRALSDHDAADHGTDKHHCQE
jgi:hypothetical protein